MDELKKIELELEEWRTFYNYVLGALAFTFALACLSIPKYVSFVAAFASLVMVSTIGDACSPRFSNTLKELRKKESRTPREQEIVDFSEETFLSNRKYMAFNFGFFRCWQYGLILRFQCFF